jgi:hypothetical protein
MLMFCVASWQMSVPPQTIRLLAQPPARRRRRKVFSFLAYNLTLVISGTNREGKTGAQASQ